ncbi:MAG TPA: DUF445 family protein [Opitutus sp.]|nr:DUF445 family protein [Opitutus sp.]
MTSTAPQPGPSREWWSATVLLAFVFSLFLVSVTAGTDATGWRALRAFAEAATVGALADWFAVVALFEAPLGLKFLVGRFGFVGHLAVLPRSQPEIARKAGEYVGSHLLPPAAIADTLRVFPIATILSDSLKTMKGDLVGIASDGMPWGMRWAGRRAARSMIANASELLENDEDIQKQTRHEIARRIERWLADNPDFVASKIREQIDRIPSAEFVGHARTLMGRDLQFIRINGTLVGGMVGLLLFAVAQLMG